MGYASGEAARAGATLKAARRKTRVKAKRRITSGEQARAVATRRNRPAPAPARKPYVLPSSFRSDAAQGRGPSSPITEVRQRNNKPVRVQRGPRRGSYSVRTFKNTDDYKAYESRLQAKAKIRAEGDQRARTRAKVVTAVLTDSGRARRKSLASDIRGQVRQEGEQRRDRAISDFNDAATRDLQSQAVRKVDRSTARRLKSAPYKAKRQIVREADAQRKLNPKGAPHPDVKIRTQSSPVRKAKTAKLRRQNRRDIEAVARGTAAAMKKLQDADLKSGQPVRGTASEVGIIRGHERNKVREQQAVLRKAKRKRRGWSAVPRNVLDEARDMVTGAVPGAVELGKVGADTVGVVGQSAQDLVRKDPLQARRSRKRRAGAKVVPFVKGTVKAIKDTSPAYALATGHPREALGRAQERPLSALGEITVAGGAATKGSRVLNAAGKVAHEGGNRRLVNRKRTNARIVRNERSFRERVSEQLAHKEATRRKRNPLRAGPVSKRRQYSAITPVRGAQKTKDAALRKAGRDPDVASTRGGKASKHNRVIRRNVDELTRNVQHGGQAREERAHATVSRAQRKAGAKRSPHKRAGLAWMTRHPILRTGDTKAVRAELERIRTFQDKGGVYDNVRDLDKLIADVDKNGDRSFVMSPRARRSAGKLAERAHASDAGAVRRGQLNEAQASGTAARQSLIESGRIVTKAEYDQRPQGVRGEGPTPSPPKSAAAKTAGGAPPAAERPKTVKPKLEGGRTPQSTTIPQPTAKTRPITERPETRQGARVDRAVTTRFTDPEPDAVASAAKAKIERKVQTEETALRQLEAKGPVQKWGRKERAVAELQDRRKELIARNKPTEAIDAAIQSTKKEVMELARHEDVAAYKAKDKEVRGIRRAVRTETPDDRARASVAAGKADVADKRRKANLLADTAEVRKFRNLGRAVSVLARELEGGRQRYKDASPEYRPQLEAEGKEVRARYDQAKVDRSAARMHPAVKRWQEAEDEAELAENDLATEPRPRSNQQPLDVDTVQAPQVRESASERRGKVRARKAAEQPKPVGEAATDKPAGAPDPGEQSIVSEQVERRPETPARAEPRVVTQEQAQTVAVDVDDVISEQATSNHRYVWAHNGQQVTNEAAIKANPQGAFVRGAKLEGDESNLLLGIPRSGSGYSPEDLLNPIADRQLDAEIEKEQRGTLARLTTRVLDSYAMRGPDGEVRVWKTPEGARKAAQRHGPGEWVEHAYFDDGERFAVIPAEVDKRIRAQLAPAGRIERGGRYLTRQAIRGTLPFSMLWHAGNIADLTARVALTTPPADWVRRGPEMARLLSEQMEQVDPDVRDELLATLKGHVGSRRTVRDPRATDILYDPESGEYKFPRLASVSNQIGDVVKQLPPSRIIDRAFDSASWLESGLVNRVVGTEARRMAQQLGHHMEDASAQMAALAKDLVDDPAKVHELGARVLEVTGDYTTRAPWERKVLRGIDPFFKWLKAANKFVFLTLPKRHPVKTALMFQAMSLSADERSKMGLNFYWSDEELDELRGKLGWRARQEGYMAGAVGDEGGLAPTGPLTSAGEAATLLGDPAKLAGRPLSFATRPLTAAGALNPALKAAGVKKVKGGYYRTPGEIALKGLPGGGEVGDLRIKQGDKNAHYKRALQLGSEVTVPGLKQARQVQEGGTKPKVYSTAWAPKSEKVGAGGRPRSTAFGLDTIVNPGHKQRFQDSETSSDVQPAVAGKGEMFQVKMRNLDGSYTVFWARRER